MRSHLVDTLRARWARAGFLDYAWWIPLVMDGCALVAGAVALAQRIGAQPVVPTAGLVLVALSPWLTGFAGWRLPWYLCVSFTVGASGAVMALYPVPYDFTLFLLVLLAGHLGATETLLRSATATGAAGALLVALDLAGEFSGSKLWVASVLVGWDVGFILQYQQRRIEEQARNQAAREARAVLEERQRIARDVHDVIAHSLTVTLLHLTAARRNLEEDGAADLSEAVDALRDAERLGRQSMTDIRRTVGLLGSGTTASLAPSPDVDGLPDLVEQFRSAGLDVGYEERHGGGPVPAAVGLCLYRVLQESLANVAKHEPTARVKVSLDTAGDEIRLQVRNTVRHGSVQAFDGSGSGLEGMRQRARLLGGVLSAGFDGSGWRVDLRLPRSEVPDAASARPQARCGGSLGFPRRTEQGAS